jgi:hypothetical protein
MLKKTILFLSLLLLAGSLALPAAAQPGPPTVTDIVIDKTDKNAVVAREQAIIEAQRTAFSTLAQRSMTPEAFKAFRLPDDQTIRALVRDFEIRDEQLSTDRYMARFTVRFTPEIANYISLPYDLPPVAAGPSMGEAAPATAAAASGAPMPEASAAEAQPPAMPVLSQKPTDAAPRNILVLPYLERPDGSKVLWNDPNPWREAWQHAGSAAPAPNLQVTVPLGDLTDISSGDVTLVWNGDYSTIEKNRANYQATDVAVALARPVSGTVDIYLYREGAFVRLPSVAGFSGDEDTYDDAIARVIGALGSSAAGAPVAAAAPAAAASPVKLAASMRFGSFSQWMEAQKRMAALSPPVLIEISSLTRDSAQFTLSYPSGLPSLQAALSAKGVALDKVDSAYEIRLAN